MAMNKSTDSFYVGPTTGDPAPQHGQRRRHNFGDRVYKLSPQETPFFAYLNAVGKYPTDDPVFRVLEDRAPTKWADRTFSLDASSNAIAIEATEGDDWIQDGANDLACSAGATDELVVGMLVQAVLYGDEVTGDHASAEMPEQVTARIAEVNKSANTIVLNTVSIGGDTNTSISSGSVTCQVIGTAFAEGTGAPDSFGYDIEDTLGYTQIFKTSAYMSNTAMATVMRGYASEWDRIWSMKLREHKVDIERAFLFNNKGIVGGLQYTDGMIGSILKSGVTANTGDTALSYASGKPYVRVVDTAPSNVSGNNEAIYDRWLADFEIIFAPERGGADQKFCMASLPVITYFNQLKGGFMDASVNSSYSYNLAVSDAEGGLGHKVMKIDTVHGSLAVVKNPLLKGIGKSMMVGVDLDNVKYRPLVGNGVNRDTYIDTNVQTPDEDSRKDLILTEAGLEVCMPESHFLYQFVNNGSPIG